LADANFCVFLVHRSTSLMTPSERSHDPRADPRWQHGATPVLGLTGGLASGKSAVASLLAERGFAVIDADSVGHEVLEGPPVVRKVVERFGTGVLAAEGLSSERGPRVNRAALAAIVFTDPGERRALEAIVHPLMRARFIEAIEQETSPARQGARPVVLDAAILLEAGWDDLCDLVVFVDAPRSERMRRAALLRGWPAEIFDSREAAQWSCEEKRRRAGFVIKNDAGMDRLPREVDRLAATLLELGPATFELPGMERPLAEPRAPGQRPLDGSGSDAWQNPCPIL
jgi:dephospho-CoA kinase